jgi:hypothetical protein
MRVCVAVAIMIDLTIRLTDLEAFYSNSGVLPLPAMFENMWNDYFISFHAISGLWQIQLVLFLLAYAFAVMLFIGYRTKLFTFLSWLIMLSLHNRNELILQGGDDVLRMTLFWGMFLPWGMRYSFDSINTQAKQTTNTFLSVACIAYLLQVCYVYTGSALLKGAEWHTDFTALYYVYSLDQIAYPITKYIYYKADVLRVFTIIAYYFELFIPLLFFIPFKHGFFRTLAVLAIILFHMFNGVTLFIGMFPLIGMVTCLGVLSSDFINWFERKTAFSKITLKRLFSSIGNFINRFLRWRMPHLNNNELLYHIKSGLIIFLIVFVFDWNFSNLSFVSSKLSNNLRFIGYGLRLDQNWGMFAPGVFKDDGWFILEGITKDGKALNLLNPNMPVNNTKPKHIVYMFKNDRWRKYSEHFIMSQTSFMRGYFCNYYKRIWNESHSDSQIVKMNIYYMGELTLPNYEYSLPKKEMLCNCAD